MTTGPPARIGRYEIVRELGRGMMGVVYEAKDPALDRRVALKTIQLVFPVSGAERSAFEERFFAEARIAGRLRHPGIVVVHDVGRDDDGTLFIAFEHLEGRTLAQRSLEDGALHWREALTIAGAVADALGHAHAQGVVHRDVKPANIMLLPNGEAKIMDFGIAKVPTSQLTAAGQIFGTPANMSPEQARGEPVDGRSDLFSLGTVLYELLAGHPAFPGDGLPQILKAVAEREPPPPSLVRPSIPAAVDAVVARLLAKDPADRYPDGRAAAAAIHELLGLPAPRDGAVSGGAGAQESMTRLPRTDVSVPTLDLSSELETHAQPLATTLDASAPTSPPRPRRRRLRLLGAGIGLVAMLAAALVFINPLAEEPLPPPVEQARLMIDFEHPLRAGSLRIFVDNEKVKDEPVVGRVTKSLLWIKLRGGAMADVLDVAPGKHDIRVEVRWDDNVKVERTRVNLAAGSTRKLEIRLGRLRKDLSVEVK